MSQRLSKARIHPLSGEEVKPLWFDEQGRAFYPVMGAAPEGDDANDDDESDEGDDTGSDDGTEGQESGNDSGTTVSKSEFDALMARMKAADKRASAAEQKAKQYEDKDKSEAERATQRVQELEAENTSMKSELKTARLQNAFLSSNDVVWHDSEVALAHADLSEVIDEDGNVNKSALKKALSDLAKAKPFLVKTEDKGGDQPPAGQSAPPVGSGKKKAAGGTDEESLRRKYPSLYS